MYKRVIFVLVTIVVLVVVFVNPYYKASVERNAKAEQKLKEESIFNQHKGEELVYVPMGDSLSEGWDSTSKEGRFVEVLSQLIKDKMGYNVQMKEVASYAGTGIKDNGIPNLPKVLEQKPHLVTIEFGTNDLFELRKNAYSTPKEFEVNLSYLIDTINFETVGKTKIILITTWYRDEKSFIYDDIIKKVGKDKSVSVVDISVVWEKEDTAGPVGQYTPFRNGASDDWHPNDLGHKLIAEEIFKVAYEILK